jgi:uncharacterized repeat protein (TIGR01451 family)
LNVGTAGQVVSQCAISPNLPPGLSATPYFDGNNSYCYISGTTTAPGDYAFTLVAVFGSGNSTYSLLLHVGTIPISISTSSLPAGFVTQFYTQTLSASGGGGSYTWSVASGSLPAGLVLSSFGVLSGTPTAVFNQTFMVQVSDQWLTTAQVQLSLSITANPLTITSLFLPTAYNGTSYSYVMNASGGIPPYTWTLDSGALPTGLVLRSSGNLVGTPLSSGTATFSARVTDSSSASVAEPFTLTVSQGAPPTAIETWSTRWPADAVSNAVYDAGRNEIVLLGMSGTWIYNNGQWTERLNVTPPTARGSTTMAYDVEHRRVVMFGGFSSPGNLLNDTWTWDGTSWTQMSPSISPPSRINHSMTYDAAHGVIVLFGGDASDGVTHYSDTWFWDGANWTQQFPVISPPARSGNSLSFDSVNNNVVLFGGQGAGAVLLNDTWIWNGTAWTQESPVTVPPARWLHATVFRSATGQTLMFGGCGNSPTACTNLNDTWSWNGVNWTNLFPNGYPDARYAHGMVYNAAGDQVLVFGGQGSQVAFEDAWAWSGSTWYVLISGRNPGKRENQSMAYDSVRGKVVLFGGNAQCPNTTYCGDTWLWDGTNWTSQFPSTSPPARGGGLMSFDAARSETVLFGGYTNVCVGGVCGTSYYNDTWIWNGSTWTQRFPPSQPPFSGPSTLMTYDAGHQQTVLVDFFNQPVSTWIWDGSSWTKMNPVNSPSPRSGGALAFDPVSQKVILFGGSVSGLLLNDTWAWDGTTWTLLNPTNSPATRSNHAMAIDNSIGQIIVTGGFSAAGNAVAHNDTWTWDGGNWSPRNPARSPAGRYYFSMAENPITGKAMLYGGEQSGTLLPDTWSFDSQTSPGIFGAASNPSPQNGASYVALNPIASWSAANGFSSYSIYLGTQPNPVYAGGTSTTTFNPGQLNPGQTYYWQVIASNGAISLSSPTWSFSTTPPVLSITSSHSGNFTQGQSGATYTLTVSNAPAAVATGGTVTVTENLPGGFTLAAMSGTGWICSSNTCMRSDPLNGGSSYPAITVLVSVAGNASSPLLNLVSVAGGGSATATAADPTNVTVNPAVLSIQKSHSGSFAQGQQNAIYTVTVSNAANAGYSSGTVTVTESLPAGMTMVSMVGTGWTCPSNGVACSRTDSLATGGSYPPITVTVNVAANATSPQVNAVMVSGGGSPNASATDSTNVTANPAMLSIVKAHNGNFTQGQQGAAYTVIVSNGAGAGPTAGAVTVTETVPAGMTLVSMSGSGWTCSANNCSRADALTGGSAYPPITVTVNISASASTPLINNVSVTGGGSANATATAADTTTILTNPAVLGVALSHTGNFVQGQQNAAYTVTVSNAANANHTSGAVTVTESLPPGLTLVSMTGAGWTCSANTCTRGDVLNAGSSYASITAVVNIGANAASPQVNAVTVSGGGSANANATDSTVITANPAVLAIAVSHSGYFTLGQQDATYAVTVSNAAGAGAAAGTVTVSETVPTGLTLVSMTGTGWTCPTPGSTCTRVDGLAPGSSYPSISVTVNVAVNAPNPDVNQVSVSGGGSNSASASDSTTILSHNSKNVVGDFDGNGVPDLVWQNTTTRQVCVHYYGGAGGAVTSGWSWLASTGTPGWTVVAVADFNGDGHPDLVWENDTTNQVVVHYYGGAGGTTYLGWNWLNSAAVPGWQVVAVADFNGDGVPDLVWQNTTTRQVSVHYYGGAGGAVLIGWNWLSSSNVPGWTVRAAADFNGDGVPDLVWQNDANGQTCVHYYGGTGGAVYLGWNYLNKAGVVGWHIKAATDFNGDGIPDLVWQDDSTGQVTVDYYGGAGGATQIGWNWLNSANAAGWSVVN